MYWKTWINQWHRAQLTFHLNKSHETAFDQKISVVCVCACEDNGDATQRETINKAQKLKRIDWLADWLTTNAIVNNLSALTHIFNQAFGFAYSMVLFGSVLNGMLRNVEMERPHFIRLSSGSMLFFRWCFFFHSVSTFFMSSFLSVGLSLSFSRSIFTAKIFLLTWSVKLDNDIIKTRPERCDALVLKWKADIATSATDDSKKKEWKPSAIAMVTMAAEMLWQCEMCWWRWWTRSGRR